MNRSQLIAAAICLAIACWMLSGVFAGTETSKSNALTQKTNGDGRALATVQFKTIEAREIQNEIVIQGSVQPLRSVSLRAETTGRVVEKRAAKGSRVRKGDIVLRLDMGDRQARLARAQANFIESKQNFDANQKLLKNGHVTIRRAAEAKTVLEASRAGLARIEQEIANTNIRAPFDGILNNFELEIGDYANVNTQIGTVVDLAKLLVEIEIAQQDIGRVAVGAQASVSLATGQTVMGIVRYVSAVASRDTRTFQVEVEIANEDNQIPSGVSAEVRIQTGKMRAHLIQPSALSLDDNGRVGIKLVSNDRRVVFLPIEVAQSDAKGLWIKALPQKIQIITVGHGFVREGQHVKAVEVDPSA